MSPTSATPAARETSGLVGQFDPRDVGTVQWFASI